MRATLTTLTLALVVLSEAAANEPDTDAKAVRAFLDAHCVRCHGKEEPEGKVSLHALSFDLKTPKDIETWKRVYEQLFNGQMPPPDKKQPPFADRQSVTGSLKAMLKAAGVKIDELKELLPARGNWIDHDALFSGKAAGEAGTPSRVWRLSPESYKQFFIRLNGQLSLNLEHILGPSSSREAPLKAPWNLARKWDFTDYSSLHRISGAEYEHHLRNCTTFARRIVGKVNNAPSLKNLKAALSAGKSATPEQLQAAVSETYDVLLRLPLDSAALKSQSGYLAKLLQTMDAPSAGEQFVISVLCHPEVLYRIERPEGDAKRGLMPQRHTARAISFTLTDREPDAVLWQAAVDGKLGTSEEVRKHIERILNDSAIPKPRLLGFFQEYFGYTTAPDIAKCTATVNEYQLSHNGGCEFQNGYAGRFVRDTDRLVEWVLESDKDVLRTLLTTRKSFWRGHAPAAYHKRLPVLYDQVKRDAMSKAAKEGKPVDEAKLDEEKSKKRDELFRAEFLGDGADGMRRDIYGLQRLDPERHWAHVRHPVLYAKPRTPSPDVDDWLAGKPYDAHPEERIGILTQASWLVSMSSNFDNHAIHRGRWIRERLLGGRILEVPITVNAMLPDEPHRGLRDRMRVTRESYCWKCHKSMDPLGLPFEQYDHFGRYREKEIVVDKEKTDKARAKNPTSGRTMTSIPIDTTGAITDSGDPKLDGDVKGPFDLIEKLAQSERVEQVFVRHVFRYFLGRNETLADGPTLVTAHKAYRDSKGSFKALLVSLLSSDPFLCRTQPGKEKNNKPKKAKKFANAWVPEGKPLRGILHFDGRQAGNAKAWQPFCERHGLVWFPHEGGDILQEKLLGEIAAELKHPELVNAPVIRVGLSSNGGYSIQLAHQHADRMLAGVAHQPLPPWAKGNEAFHFNRINEKGTLEGKVHDISQSFRVPCILQAGENDPVCGTIMAYGLAHYARSQKAPWTYFCLPRGGHGNVVPNELLMAWLDGVITQRLPADVDLSKGLPKLKDIRIEAGWLANPHTLEIAGFAKYPGDKSKATWLPNEASALAWKKLGRAMPFELPEQSIKHPSGLIDKLVIHDPKSNRVVPSDAVHAEPWKIVANLKPGDTGWKVQPNCSVTVIGKVPELVRGCDWIKPDNAAAGFEGDVLLEFTVTDKAIIYVGHDKRVEKRPDWLAEWKDTGEAVQGGYLGNERNFRLFEKAFPKGAVVKLGPNGKNAEKPKKPEDSPWIYLAIVKPAK